MNESHDLAQKDFFISYNKADRYWAEWIAWQLEDEGYTTVLQAWDFRAGSNFVLKMDNAARGTGRTIAVLSEDYLTSLYTQSEWASAFIQDPAGKNGILLPVRVRKCKPMGLLASINYIDLVEQNEQEARRRLLEGIKPGRAKPKTAPDFPSRVQQAQAITGKTLRGEALRLLQEQPGFPRNLPRASKAIQVFYSFAPEDENLLKSLEKQLALLKQLGLITDWHSGKIQAGQETDREFERHWKSAQIILLLISANFIASKSCYNIAQRAMERSRTGGICVIPIILRPVDWKGAPFDGLAVLPKNMRPITSWSNQDDAFLEVAKGIRQAAEELISPGR